MRTGTSSPNRSDIGRLRRQLPVLPNRHRVNHVPGGIEKPDHLAGSRELEVRMIVHIVIIGPDDVASPGGNDEIGCEQHTSAERRRGL